MKDPIDETRLIDAMLCYASCYAADYGADPNKVASEKRTKTAATLLFEMATGHLPTEEQLEKLA